MGVGGAEDVDFVGEEGGGCGYEAESWGVIGVGFRRLPRVVGDLQSSKEQNCLKPTLGICRWSA